MGTKGRPHAQIEVTLWKDVARLVAERRSTSATTANRAKGCADAASPACPIDPAAGWVDTKDAAAPTPSSELDKLLDSFKVGDKRLDAEWELRATEKCAGVDGRRPFWSEAPGTSKLSPSVGPGRVAAMATALGRSPSAIVCATSQPGARPRTGFKSCDATGEFGRPSATEPCEVQWNEACRYAGSPTPASAGVAKMVATVADEATFTLKCKVPPAERYRVLAGLLSTVDLGKFDPRLTGETYGTISEKFLSFVRKGGELRSFVRAHKLNESNVVLKDIDNAALGIGKDEREDVKRQNTSGVARARRETLRRGVDQWTDAFEYEQYTDTLKRRGLFADYAKAERAALANFATDCSEAVVLCGDPQTDREREICTECAKKAVADLCVVGTSATTERKRCEPGAWSAGHWVYTGGDKKEWEPSRQAAPEGKTFFVWLAEEMIYAARQPSLHRRGALNDGTTLMMSAARAVVATRFLVAPSGGGSSTSGAVTLNNLGRKHLDKLSFKQMLKVLLEGLGEAACKFAGGFVFDLVLAALSGGTTAFASIAKHLEEFKNMVDVMKKVTGEIPKKLENTVNFTKEIVMGVNDKCKEP